MIWGSWFPGILRWCCCLKLQSTKKKSSARHVYFIWRTYTECHFHSFRPQNFKTQRVSSLGIQKVSTDLWLLKNVAEICCILRNSSDSDNNLVAYVFGFFPISVSSLILLSRFLKDSLKCTTSKSKNLGHRMTKGDWLWSRESYLMCKAPSAFYFWILFWYPLQQRWSPGLSTVEYTIKFWASLCWPNTINPFDLLSSGKEMLRIHNAWEILWQCLTTFMI